MGDVKSTNLGNEQFWKQGFVNLRIYVNWDKGHAQPSFLIQKKVKIFVLVKKMCSLMWNKVILYSEDHHDYQ